MRESKRSARQTRHSGRVRLWRMRSGIQAIHKPHLNLTVERKNIMAYSQKDFEVLDALDNHEITTQRQLSEYTGISLGQVNYVLKSLLEKGLVKIGNFRKNQNKIGYA